MGSFTKREDHLSPQNILIHFSNSMFIHILLNCEPVRQGILGMLKPVDIVSLVFAARIVTTPWERNQVLDLISTTIF